MTEPQPQYNGTGPVAAPDALYTGANLGSYHLIPASMVMDMPMIVGSHQENEVQFALDFAARAAEAYCERSFGRVLNDTIVANPYFSHIRAMPAIAPMASYGSYPGYGISFSAYGSPYVGTALLPNPPVTAVWNIEAWMPLANLGGGMGWVTLNNFSFAEDGYVWDTSGMPGIAQSDAGPLPSWPHTPRSLRITYDHGFTLPGTEPNGESPELPQGIIDTVIRAAAQILVNPADIAAYSAGIISMNFHSLVPGGTTSLLDTTALAPYRLVHL